MMTSEIIEKALRAIQADYVDFLLEHFSQWHKWAEISNRMEAGEKIEKNEVPLFFQKDYEWIKYLSEKEPGTGFDWKDPVLANLFSGTAETPYYKLWGRTISSSALRLGKIIGAKTLLEIGAGSGSLTRIMLERMEEEDRFIPIVLTDSNPSVIDAMRQLKTDHPNIIKEACIWDINEKPGNEIRDFLEPPVVIYERASFNYSNYASLRNIAVAGDLFVFGDFFKYRNKLFGYDRLSEKIGLKPLMYSAFKNLLDELNLYDYLFDLEATEKLGYPDVTMIIAWK